MGGKRRGTPSKDSSPISETKKTSAQPRLFINLYRLGGNAIDGMLKVGFFAVGAVDGDDTFSA